MAPSMTNTSSSPACRCSGSLASGAMRVIIARRLLSGCAQMSLPRTPGWRSCHGRSLSEMICDRGVVVVLMGGFSCSRDVVPGEYRAPPRGSTRPVLLGLELQVLVGRGNRIAGDQPETRFVHPPADAVDEGQLVHRRDHRLVGHELLEAMQQGLALGTVELAGLLAKEPVDVRVAAVRELTARDHVGLEARGGVAEA